MKTAAVAGQRMDTGGQRISYICILLTYIDRAASRNARELAIEIQTVYATT